MLLQFQIKRYALDILDRTNSIWHSNRSKQKIITRTRSLVQTWADAVQEVSWDTKLSRNNQTRYFLHIQYDDSFYI